MGKIIKVFEQEGFSVVAMMFLQVSDEHFEQQYVALKDRSVFPGLAKCMDSRSVVAMVWKGLDIVKSGRLMLGEATRKTLSWAPFSGPLYSSWEEHHLW